MSEEFDESPKELAVLISVVAVDSDSVNTATRLKLEIEGDADLIMVFAELNVVYLETMFGENFTLTDSEGNPIATPRPTPIIIDPLAEDPPVTE